MSGNNLPESDHTPLGFKFFFFYVIIYTIFVLLNTFYADKIASLTTIGINIPVIYGFALIFSAVFLALVYSWVFRKTGSHSGELDR